MDPHLTLADLWFLKVILGQEIEMTSSHVFFQLLSVKICSGCEILSSFCLDFLYMFSHKHEGH